jgi:hypothetical protein
MPLLPQLGHNWTRKFLILGAAAAAGAGLGIFFGIPEEVAPTPLATQTQSDVEVQVRELTIFHGLSFTRRDGNTSAVQVIILAGDEQAVSVVAKRGQHKSVQTRVIDGILYIQLDRDLQDTGVLRIQVSSPRIRSIRMDGVSSVLVNGGLRAPSVRLEASRGAQITVRRIGARQVNMSASQGGRILVGGRTGLLRAEATEGVIDARDLIAEVATVSSISRSRIEVFAQDRLEAYARDRASILYRTMPRRMLQDLDSTSRLQML